MSRIGKQPVDLPPGVTAEVNGQMVTVKGQKGELQYMVHPDIAIALESNRLVCAVKRSSKQAAALWGTTRARLANVVRGVDVGYRKELELRGVGYRAKKTGDDLELSVVEGRDKVRVGQVAADIRAVRKPEPYKGKGIRYRGEVVRHKVGKMVGTTE